MIVGEGPELDADYEVDTVRMTIVFQYAFAMEAGCADLSCAPAFEAHALLPTVASHGQELYHKMPTHASPVPCIFGMVLSGLAESACGGTPAVQGADDVDFAFYGRADGSEAVEHAGLQ